MLNENDFRNEIHERSVFPSLFHVIWQWMRVTFCFTFFAYHDCYYYVSFCSWKKFIYLIFRHNGLYILDDLNFWQKNRKFFFFLCVRFFFKLFKFHSFTTYWLVREKLLHSFDELQQLVYMFAHTYCQCSTYLHIRRSHPIIIVYTPSSWWRIRYYFCNTDLLMEFSINNLGCYRKYKSSMLLIKIGNVFSWYS